MSRNLLLFAILGGWLWGSPRPACAADVATLLRSVPPGDSIRFGRSGDWRWAEYCPDNTCERIEVDAEASRADLERFFAGYLWRAGTYLHLKDWRRRDGLGVEVRGRLAGLAGPHCRSEDVDCALAWFARRYRARGEFIRYDEGGGSIGRFSVAQAIASPGEP